MSRFMRAGIALVAGITAAAAGAADYEPLDVRYWPTVVAAPDSGLYTVQETLSYPSGGERLPFALYRPIKSANPPVVLIVNGVGDATDDRPMDWTIYRSWGALFAANGIAAVTMSAKPDQLDQNLADLVEHLETRGESLGIDPTRLSLFAASANTALAGRFLTSDKGLASVDSAIFYYGSAPAGTLPREIPVLFVVTEGDMRSPFANAYPPLWQRVIQDKAPWTMLFASSQPHAFDALDPTPESRRIIAQTVDFARRSLIPLKAAETDHAEEQAVLRTLYNNEPQVAIETLQAYLANHPDSVRAKAELAKRLADSGRTEEAGAAIAAAFAANPRDGSLAIAWSRLLLGQGKAEEAYQAAKAAVDAGYDNVAAVGQLGLAALSAGHMDDAIGAFQKAAESPVARASTYYNLACAYALKGDGDAALDALGKAIDNGYRDAAAMRSDKDLASLRDDPRFADLLARIS